MVNSLKHLTSLDANKNSGGCFLNLVPAAVDTISWKHIFKPIVKVKTQWSPYYSFVSMLESMSDTVF